MRTKRRKFTTYIMAIALVFALALTSGIGLFAAKPTSANAAAATPTKYIEPVDNSTDQKANDGGCRVWFKATAGEADWPEQPGAAGDAGWGMQNAPLIRDNVLINGKTFTELNASWNGGTAIGGKKALERFYVAYFSGTKIAFGFHMDQAGKGAFSIKDVKTVEIKKGFNWYKSDKKTAIAGMKTNENFTLELFKRGSDYYFGRQLKQNADNTAIAADAATLGGTAFKTDYYQGDALDLTGVTIAAKYNDGGTRTIPVLPHMVTGYNKNTASAQNLTINYNGATFAKTVTVTIRPINKIELIAGEYKKAYKYAEPINVANMNLKVTYTDGGVLASTPVTKDMISGYDSAKLGEQTLTITYGVTPKTTTFKVTVTDITEINELVPELNATFGRQDGICIFLKPSAPVTGVKNLWGVQNCPMVADKILINGMTFKELNATYNNGVPIGGKYPLERIMTISVEDKPTLLFHMDQRGKPGGFEIADIKTVTVLAGLNFCTNTADLVGDDSKGGTYTAIPGVVTRKNYYFANYQNRLVKELKKNEAGALAEDALKVKTPAKTSYVKGELFDFASIRLNVKYNDGTSAVVTPTAADISGFDSNKAGEQTVTISHNGGSYTQVVNVKAVDITSITVSGDYKKVYDIFDDLSVKDMILTLNYEGGNTKGDIKVNMLSGYTKGKLGAQTITVTFMEKTTTFNIEVKDEGKSANISFSGYTPFDETYGSLVVSFSFTENVKADFKAIWNIDKGANTGDKIKINGILVSELIKQKKVARLCAYGTTLIFHMDADLVVSEEMYNYKCLKQDGYKEKYPTFASVKVVETVEIMEGFQYYTADKDYWGSDPGENLMAVPGGVIRRSVTLNNDGGYRYIRPFKMDGDKIAADALTITTNPKLVYEIDEAFDATGMIILAKYADGGEESIIVADSWVKGFDPTKVGKQTLSVRYNDHEVKFEATVKEKPVAAKPTGCGASAATVLMLALGAGLMLIKKVR